MPRHKSTSSIPPLLIACADSIEQSTMMMHPHDRRPPSRYQHHDPPPPPPNGSNWLSIILRICGLVLAVTCATVMAASDVCTGYTHFGGFVFVVGSNITASILEAVAIYLHIRLNQAAAAVRDHDIKEEEEGIGPAARIVLLAVDIMLVPALLLTAMGAAFTQAAASNDQISACSAFAAQVMRAKILSFFACVVLMLAAFFKIVPFQFNMPPY